MSDYNSKEIEIKEFIEDLEIGPISDGELLSIVVCGVFL
jgi:hypothetical protein